MSWLLGYGFRSYTIFAVTSALPGYEAEKLAVVDEHPLLRSWRSNNQVTQQVITIDLGAPVVVGAVALLNTNCTAVQLQHSTSSGSGYVDFPGSQFTVNQHWTYYKLCARVTATPRYIRAIFPAQTPINGKPYMELGSLLVPSVLVTFNPPRIGMTETLTRPYDESGFARRAAGPFALSQEWDFVQAEANIPIIRALAMLGEDTPFLIAETNATTEKCALRVYRGDIPFTRNVRYENVKISTRELA